MKWKSNASYKQTIENGTIFTLRDNSISVHRILGLSGWFLSCHELGFSQRDLHCEEFDDAVRMAKQLIRNKLNEINIKYNQFLQDDSDNEIVRYF